MGCPSSGSPLCTRASSARSTRNFLTDMSQEMDARTFQSFPDPRALPLRLRLQNGSSLVLEGNHHFMSPWLENHRPLPKHCGLEPLFRLLGEGSRTAEPPLHKNAVPPGGRDCRQDSEASLAPPGGVWVARSSHWVTSY